MFLHSSAATVAAWINPDDLQAGPSYLFIVSKGGANRLYLHTDGRVRFQIYKPDGSKAVAKPSVSIPNATWTHVVGTYDGVNLIVYINGQQVKTISSPGSIKVNNNALFLGARTASKKFFAGNLDDVRVYDTSLNAQEVLDLFNGN